MGLPARPTLKGPARWIASHVIRHWSVAILALGGAFGNASLAGVVPVLLGQVFTIITDASPDLWRLL
ncbi:MAG: hypothetical protein HPY59_12140 [Anaerolineae bacterium]|nr:hypothetical protein [Anaerolineae bacterium]